MEKKGLPELDTPQMAIALLNIFKPVLARKVMYGSKNYGMLGETEDTTTFTSRRLLEVLEFDPKNAVLKKIVSNTPFRCDPAIGYMPLARQLYKHVR
jgi:hypothetical protein